MLRCYEKTYCRNFIDSEKKWREIDKLRKLQIEQNREQQSMKIVDPRLVNQNSLLGNNEELIKRMEFRKKIEESLPKRYFEGKSNDFIRSDFVKPNYDKLDYSANVFNSYNNNNNNNNNIVKDNFF
jgi:hypothetical protein